MTGILGVHAAISLDVVFFVAIILGIALGAWKGFVKQVTKAAGWIFSILVALFFCIALANSLESWFGLTSAIAKGIHNYKIAHWISVAISFVGLGIIVRLLALLFGFIGTKICEKNKFLAFLNGFLGAIWGLFAALMFVFTCLAICSWIPNASLHNFIGSSYVVKYLFNWDWFHAILSNVILLKLK